MCISATENVEDKELPPKRRHVEIEIQEQPERAEESQGIITNGTFTYSTDQRNVC